ncbi:hypothetical protein [Peribacillus frigoritolerans]|uniref:hypothetical protein n=1 Tax=Peribacillus frigoritolerans TaxID=450367 RepID=UPI001F4F228E|nr:hypothetical protein [Peribacillus frigoritolerans]MCK2017954.1 hypothetical protein [Peribacillus frigoritolerans]
MALFGGKETSTVTDKEYVWKKNEIKIENGYLVSKGIINNIRYRSMLLKQQYGQSTQQSQPLYPR